MDINDVKVIDRNIAILIQAIRNSIIDLCFKRAVAILSSLYLSVISGIDIIHT